MNSMLVRRKATLVVGIEAHERQGAVSSCRSGNVQRTIGANGLIAHKQTSYGNKHPPLLEQQPEHEEAQIDNQEEGKGEPDVGQPGEGRRVQSVGIAHQQHQQNGCHIGSGNHLQCEFLQSFQHESF